jgi:tetratricopeptide (TPR) repeat protein
MIVKDEATVITRAFDSVKHIVDYYVICDTGSTDDTIQVMKDYWKENKLKGEVHEHPWVHFGHNRTEAFKLARGKCDYIMTLDADEVFCPIKEGEAVLTSIVKKLPSFQADSISVPCVYGRLQYLRSQFFKDGLDWYWDQPVHEYAKSMSASTTAVLKDVCIHPTPEGARARTTNVYHKDALVFEKWLLDNPYDDRSWFYLAQSYRDAKKYDKALEAIDKAIEYTTWDEQLFQCYLRKARLLVLSGKEVVTAVGYFLKAYDLRPIRAEPLHDLLQYYQRAGEYNSAVLVGEKAITIPFPSDEILFVERDVYTWRIKDELATSIFYTGDIVRSIELTEELINSDKTPSSELERLNSNLEKSKRALDER